jgi:uncharacterized protein YegL
LGQINIDVKRERETKIEYIPSSKIYFILDKNEPIIFSQKSLLYPNENNYVIRYRYTSKKDNDTNLNPAIFIFLIDQSGSMSGDSIEIASKALLLFLQSLPKGSYYQIIGFGSSFETYDKEPKEYNEENIKNSITLINQLKANLGGTNIYDPLKFIYESDELYDKINLPRNVFLLTDGEIVDKEKTLSLIENNSNKYSIYSIGIGTYFDEDLIKNAGILGKGNYNFCKNIENLNTIIVGELNNAVSSYITNFEIKSFLNDKKNIVKNIIPNVIRRNKIIDLFFIIDNKEEKINKNQKKKIIIDISYVEHDTSKKEEKKMKDMKLI